MSPNTWWVIMGMILLITIFHYALYYYQNDTLDNRLKAATETFQANRWKDVENIINISTITARASAVDVSNHIVRAIDLEYPDINELREEFDSGNYTSPKFIKIILNSIEGEYLFGIHSHNNDIFVMNKSGIIADMNVEKFDKVQRGIKDEINTHFNPTLAFNSLEAIILKKNPDALVFYEPNYPTYENHTIIMYPSMDQVREVYYREGLEGLKNYTFLVPAYITDNGDLFGNTDIGSDGLVNMTHKIIVVQRFNVYDIIKNSFETQVEAKEKLYNDMVAQINETKHFYTFAFVAMLLLDIILILVFLIHTTGTLPEEEIEV